MNTRGGRRSLSFHSWLRAPQVSHPWLLLAGLLLLSGCAALKSVDRAAAAIEDTAKALKEDAKARTIATERAGNLLEQLTPYLVGGAGVLLAGASIWKQRRRERARRPG